MTSRSHGNVDLVGGGASAAGQSAAAAAAAADAADAAAEAEAAAIAGRSRLHGHPRHVKGQSRPAGRYERSSALSDTSEAPSIASHVRRVRVPSQASDVDQVQMAFDWITKESFSLIFSFFLFPQFLDDLFMPVLDSGERAAGGGGGEQGDGLSDARYCTKRYLIFFKKTIACISLRNRCRSLATSMKGISDDSGSSSDEEVAEALDSVEAGKASKVKRKSVLKMVSANIVFPIYA